MKHLLLSALAALTSCTASVPQNAWFPGTWSRSDSLGDLQSTHTSWTFDRQGTVTRDGYPPVSASARYQIATLTTDSATLDLTEKSGEQADWLPDRMELRRDPATRQLSVDGGPPLTRQPD